MKTITTYMADDGKTFDNYSDCYEYELNQSLSSIDARIRMFDECLNPMTEKLTTANSENILGRCAYIYLADEAAVNIMQDLYDEFGYISFLSQLGIGIMIMRIMSGFLLLKRLKN